MQRHDIFCRQSFPSGPPDFSKEASKCLGFFTLSIKRSIPAWLHPAFLHCTAGGCGNGKEHINLITPAGYLANNSTRGVKLPRFGHLLILTCRSPLCTQQGQGRSPVSIRLGNFILMVGENQSTPLPWRSKLLPKYKGHGRAFYMLSGRPLPRLSQAGSPGLALFQGQNP